MSRELIILIVEAIAIYLLVLGTHALRRHVGLAHFYALLGGLTAIMSWVTDAGLAVHVGGMTFMVGSTVFYTSLLLGVFVIYVFDGPHATRIAISTIAGVSVLVPIVAVVLHFQMRLTGDAGLSYVPVPSLRINTASVVATVMDLLFLAFVWEFLGKPKPPMSIGLRAFITLLGVMWLDVLLFGTGAFLGTSEFLGIVKGTFLSRLAIAMFAWPFLYGYLIWQNRRPDTRIENRPVLAILKEVAEVRGQLTLAQQEIERRKQAERRQRELEMQLRQSQKLESIGTLAGGVAHEINNPINGIMNYAQLILDKLGPDSPVAGFATEITRESERVAAIIRQLLHFAREDEEQGHSSARVFDIVNDTLSLVRSVLRHDQITLDLHVPEDLPKITCRSQQIQQVIMNLLANARQALNAKYPGPDPDKIIVITARELPDSTIRITVEDHGTGIPHELGERIFDPFFTTRSRDQGAGLGLSISQSIVKDHYGQLTVETEPGAWTKFHVDLPLATSLNRT